MKKSANFEFGAVHLVDLVKSLLTVVYLEKSASIQPRTGLPKVAKKLLYSFFLPSMMGNTSQSKKT